MGTPKTANLVRIKVTKDSMTACFLNSRITSVCNDEEPWLSIEEAFIWSGLETLHLDFRNVKFLSSVALGKIVALNRKIDRRLKLHNLSDKILEVFLVSRLDRIVSIAGGRNKAAA
jgi:hypothetical protein